jgi:hypothetical protein
MLSVPLNDPHTEPAGPTSGVPERQFANLNQRRIESESRGWRAARD